MEKIMIQRLLTINQRDIFHLTKRQSAVLKRNNAIKTLQKQYTFSLPAQLDPNNDKRHRTTNANIRYELPVKCCVSKDAVVTQTTHLNTDHNDYNTYNKIKSLKHQVNTENNYHMISSRNKDYKKSLTSCDAGQINKTSSFHSIGHSASNTLGNIKAYNKMNNNHISNEPKAFKSSFINPTNTSHIRNSSYHYEPIIINPLEVPEEDKIFNELNINQDDQNVQAAEVRPQTQGKPIIVNSQLKPLARIYKLPPDLLANLEKAKKKKRILSLERYQSHLIEAAGDSLSKEYKQKLERKFFLLRVQCRQMKTKPDQISLTEIEEREKVIIDQTNHESAYYNEMMKTAHNGFRKTRFILPDIKFESVLKDNIV